MVILKSLKHVIAANQRYFMVLLLFLLVLFYNNVNQVVEAELPSEKTGINQDTNLFLGSKDERREVPSGGVIGDKYRITFDIKVRPSEAHYPQGIFEKLEGKEIFALEELTSTTLNVYVASDFNEETLIHSFTTQGSNFYSAQEISFIAPITFSKLVFVRSEKKDDNQIFLSAFRLTQLLSGQAFPSAPGFIKNNNFRETINAPVAGKKLKVIYTFRKNNRVAGQVFKAQTDYLTGASFCLDFGDEIKGNYILQLNEASLTNGRYEISPVVLTQTFINKENISGFAESKENIYHIPINHKIERDKYYFIGFDAIHSSISPLTGGLKIFGNRSSSEYTEGAALAVTGRKNKEIGDFYFKIWGMSDSGKDGELLPNGSFIEKISPNVGRYLYETPSHVSDYLNLEESERNRSKAFYSFKEGVAAPAESGNYFIFSIDTQFLSTKLRLEISTLEDNFGTVVHYSTDRINWKEVERKKDASLEESGKEFVQVITDSSNKYFLRFSPNPDTKKSKGASSFGFKRIKVLTELQLDGVR